LKAAFTIEGGLQGSASASEEDAGLGLQVVQLAEPLEQRQRATTTASAAR